MGQFILGASPAPVWTEKHYSNLRTFAAWNFLVDGASVLRNGVTWNRVNSVSADILGFDGATGLRVDPLDGLLTDNLWSGGDTAARVTALISELISGWNHQTDTIALIVRFGSAPALGANFDAVVACVQNGIGAPIGANDFLKAGKFWNAGLKATVSDGDEVNVVTGTEPDTVEFVLYPDGTIRGRVGRFNYGAASRPTPESNTNWTALDLDASIRQFDLGIATPTQRVYRYTSDDAALGLACFDVASATDIIATFTDVWALRVE